MADCFLYFCLCFGVMFMVSFEVRLKKYLKDSLVAYDVAFKGCQRALINGRVLYHWVLTSAPDVGLDAFESFDRLLKRFAKLNVSFDFFVVEAKNVKEGVHLHVIVAIDSDGFGGKAVLRNEWIMSHHSDYVKIRSVDSLKQVVRLCKYTTFGNHRKSMRRFGFSRNWLSGGGF